MPDQIPVRAVRTGGLDHIEVPTRDEALIAALERERAGYIQRGLTDRAAAVDAELARLAGTDTSRKDTDRDAGAQQRPAGRRRRQPQPGAGAATGN